MQTKDHVLDFWFDEDHIPLHFSGGPDFDQKIRDKFLETWERGSQGLLVDWRSDIHVDWQRLSS